MQSLDEISIFLDILGHKEWLKKCIPMHAY